MRRSAASAELTRQVAKSTPAAYERVSKDDAHLGFFHSLLFNDCCLVVSAQTTVEAPRLLEVPVEIPQVQFLDKFDTPVMCVLFDKVVDVPVVLCNGICACRRQWR